MNDSLEFRKKCRKSQKELINIKNERNDDTIDSITIINSQNVEAINESLDVKLEEENRLQNHENLKEEEISIKSNTESDDEPLSNFIDYDLSDNANDHTDDSLKPVEIEQKFIKVQHLESESVCKIENVVESFERFVKSQANRRINCKLCSKSLSYRSLASHMTACHPGTDEKRAKCEFCDRFILKSKLNRHKKLMHGICDDGNKEFICGVRSC